MLVTSFDTCFFGSVEGKPWQQFSLNENKKTIDGLDIRLFLESHVVKRSCSLSSKFKQF